MAATLDTRPAARTYDVETLVAMARQGRIRVPHFQRNFRWTYEDVRRLFDSIVRGYPIGSLLLWVRPSPQQVITLGALHIEAPDVQQALWVVDGQQRITSLANALSEEGYRDSRFALAYDLERKEFVSPPAIDNPLVIPLPVLFDLQQILRWFAARPEAASYVDAANEITKQLRQYAVPAAQVEQQDARVLQDIFDRMNNYGKKLSRSEIFSALNAVDERDAADALTFGRIAQHIDTDLDFGLIDEDTVLKALLARRGPDVAREIRNEFAESGDEGRDVAFRAGEEALRLAVRFLQEVAGVPHISLLSYRYLVVVLTRLFAFHPAPNTRNLQLLRRWFWRASIAGPEHFKGNVTGAARSLCAKVSRDDLTRSLQDLLDAVPRHEAGNLPDVQRFRTNEADTKIILCGWWAAQPWNLESLKPYERLELSETLAGQRTPAEAVRYIVRSTGVPEHQRFWAADRVLMPAVEENMAEIAGLILDRPRAADNATWAAALRSHAITVDMVRHLTSGDIRGFLDARHEQLQRDLGDFLLRCCEWGFDDTGPLAELVVDDESEADVAR